LNSAISTLSGRFDLEKKFVLWLAALALATYAAYGILEARGSSMLATTLVIGCVGAAASVFAHYVVFRPIRRLVVVAEAVGAGDFSQRLRPARRDELGSLARAMDTMCNQLQEAQVASEQHILALDQLRHSDRIATLGRLASSVAHELGNPLNAIELRAELISSVAGMTHQQAQQHAVAIMEQTRRMTRIIEEILSFARVHPATITRLDLVAVLRKAIALSEHTSRRHQCQIWLEAPPGGMEIDGDPDKLLQVVVNLVINGVQAMPGGGSVNVRLTEQTRASVDDAKGPTRAYACIEVSDRGVGIPAESMPKLFQPFFSTKVAQGGTGLGLSVAQGIAREHEGWISVESELGAGTLFKVYLPTRDLRGEHVHGS